MKQTLRTLVLPILLLSTGFQISSALPAAGKPVSKATPKPQRKLDQDEKLNKEQQIRVLKAIKGASVLELYSLNPMQQPEFPGQPVEPKFVKWQFWGKYKVTAQEGAKMLRVINDGLTADNARSTNCIFSPRHGLKIQTPAGIRDLVICFECGEILVSDPNSPRKGIFAVLNGGGEVFEAVLKNYQLQTPLPARPKGRNSKSI
jgi:hypothetical protein